MKKWKLFTGVALLFIFGVLVGAIGTGLFIRHMHPLFKNDPADRKAFILSRLNRELELSDNQRQRIEPILDRAQTRAFSLVQKHRNDMLAIVENGFMEIKNVLDPNQQEAFERLKLQLDERRKKIEGRFLPPAMRPRTD